MIEIVINYIQDKDEFRIYEPTTDTILVSKNLTEALVNLSNFLINNNLGSDILNCTEISYHLDSYTLKKMIESNVNLMKKLNTAPSAFMISSQKFGSTISQTKLRSNGSSVDSSNFNKGKLSRGKHNFSGKSGFKDSNRKFGRKM